VVQPDVTRLGGLTGWLKAAALAELHHRPLSPHLLPEIGVHLACGLPTVMSVEYMPWLWRYNSREEGKPCLLMPEPRLQDGRLLPPTGPGLGLEIDPDVVAKCRVQF